MPSSKRNKLGEEAWLWCLAAVFAISAALSMFKR
jgi:hypothetical protein